MAIIRARTNVFVDCAAAICPVVICPICFEVLGNTLKVYFPLATNVPAPIQQKLLVVPVKELQLATRPSRSLREVKDGRTEEEEKLVYVRFIEGWRDQYPDAESV